MRDATLEDIEQLLNDGIESAFKACEKFPQPNYVCGKLCEEAGEVVRAFIHRAENRGTTEELRKEVVQLIGLTLRLYFEGDETVTNVAPDLSGK